MGSSKKSSKSSKKGKKAKIDETKNDQIKEKAYITKEIETSITLLESPEKNIVLESLLFLSKYADIQTNNLNFLQQHGLLPKLLALLEHNICILRVSLRLLSKLLNTEAAQIQLNQKIFDEPVLKICKLYISHHDPHVKEFSALILAAYCKLERPEILLQEQTLIKSILKTIKSPENDVILNSTLEMFSKFLEIQQVRQILPQEENFNLDTFILQMSKSEDCFNTILGIFEKMTYFGEDILQHRLKECHLIEHIIHLIVDPEKQKYLIKYLNIFKHSMGNENTNTYFIESFEFLKFCQWARTCPEQGMQITAEIFLELSKIDSVKQILFDLSVEDTILSFLRSDDKYTLNCTCEAISHMSRHKYCCEKMLTPIVMKKILQILQRTGDVEDPNNEVALTTLHYFARRDSRTIHMIRAYEGIDILLKYLSDGTERLSANCYKRLLEIINMFVTNHQLQKYILCQDLFDSILKQIKSEFNDVAVRSLEILANCLNHKDFQDHFLSNKGPQIIIDKLSDSEDEMVTKLLMVFIHNAMMYEKMAHDFVHNKLLLTLKAIPENIKYKIPLIDRTIKLIYNMCLPIKFFETSRLELTDKLTERFYVINGPWTGPFPFLEVLELRQMCTRHPIYIVDNCTAGGVEVKKHWYNIHQQNTLQSSTSSVSLSSLSSVSTKCSINYGSLTHDRYLPIYISKVEKLLEGVSDIQKKVEIIAKFVDNNLCGPKPESVNDRDKMHDFKLHIECIKEKLGTSLIPIGYLRLGFHCERALLFKALADAVHIPATLVKGKNKLYWNEIALLESHNDKTVLKMFVVDLMKRIGRLMLVGSRECNSYCDIQ